MRNIDFDSLVEDQNYVTVKKKNFKGLPLTNGGRDCGFILKLAFSYNKIFLHKLRPHVYWIYIPHKSHVLADKLRGLHIHAKMNSNRTAPRHFANNGLFKQLTFAIMSSLCCLYVISQGRSNNSLPANVTEMGVASRRHARHMITT